MTVQSRLIRALASLVLAPASLLLLGAAPATAPESGAAVAEKEYVLGVFPHLPPRDLENVFAPIANDLGEHVGRRVVLRSNTTFERFTENLNKQQFDIAFVQPFDYVFIADRYGYKPLATRTEKLAAIVVVNPAGPFNALKDLKGKRIALPPESAAVTALLRAHLKSSGLDPDKDVTLSYHRSHMSCMQQVMIGEVDACGTASPALRFFEKKMKSELKVIARSREIPHTLFAVHPRVPAKDRELLRTRILSWGETPVGKELLARGELTPFVSIQDADYNVVRAMAR
jgi:phosphonate transport system substrate-binding protein